MNKKISRNIFYSAFSLVAISVPMALTSCASTTYYSIPMQIGAESSSDPASPWSKVFSSTTPWTDITFNGQAPNSKNINDYTPNHFLMDESKSTSMGYCQPQKVDGEALTDSNLGWNTPALTAFDKDNTKIVSYRNSNLSAAIDYSTYVGEILSTYYNVALNYMGQPGIATNPNTTIRDNWMNALFGANPSDLSTLGFDMSTAEAKDLFYNFIFSNANMLTSASPIEFKIDKVNFHYENSYYGPGPLLSTNPSNQSGTEIVDDQGTNDGSNTPLVDLLLSNWQINDALKNGSYYNGDGAHHVYVGNKDNELVPNDAASPTTTQYKVGGITYQTGSHKGYTSPYVSYVTNSDTKEITNVSFSAVPILLSSDNVEFTYSKFKNYISYNPNDWMLENSEIQNAVNKSSSWDKYSNFTGNNPTIDSNTITISQPQNDLKIPTNPDTNCIFPRYSYSAGTPHYLFKNPSDTVVEHNYHMDPAALSIGKKLYENGKTNQYIGFVQYGCSVKKDENGDTFLYPFTFGWPDLYPVWLFQNNLSNNSLDDSFDESLLSFKDNSSSFGGSIVNENQYGAPYAYACNLDQQKVAKKFSDYFYGFYQKYVKPTDEPYPTNLTTKQRMERQYSLWFTENMFGNPTTKTTPSDFIS